MTIQKRKSNKSGASPSQRINASIQPPTNQTPKQMRHRSPTADIARMLVYST